MHIFQRFLFGLILLVAGCGQDESVPAEHGVLLNIYYDDVRGLELDDPVEYKGTEVGYIRSIEFTPGKLEQVVVQIDVGSYKIPKGSRFVLDFDGLEGGSMIAIEEASSPEEGHYAHNDKVNGEIRKGLRDQIVDQLDDLKNLSQVKFNKMQSKVQLTKSQLKLQIDTVKDIMARLKGDTVKLSPQLKGLVKRIQRNMDSIQCIPVVAFAMSLPDSAETGEFKTKIKHLKYTIKSTTSQIRKDLQDAGIVAQGKGNTLNAEFKETIKLVKSLLDTTKKR